MICKNCLSHEKAIKEYAAKMLEKKLIIDVCQVFI